MTDNKQRRHDSMKELDRALARRDRAEKTKPLGVVVATLAILVVIVGGIWLLTKQGDEADTTATETKNNEPKAVELMAMPVDGELIPMKREQALPETVTCTYDDDGEAAKPVDKPKTENVPAKGKVTVTLKTNQGDIPMELDRALSPCAVNAIEHLAKSNFYDDSICHRATGGMLNVLQCGDPTGTGSGGPGFKYAGEWPIKDANLDMQTPMIYQKGSIAMANPGDPDANGSQFFLNWADSNLPPQYVVLGSMSSEGTNVAEKIAGNGIEGTEGMTDGKPFKEVRIEKAEAK
ncbi:peptidylprolyl isomerase [Corynebacterium sp. H78]|uniref:peptidylprolyl isomerase n=1 Tax=Corynebacterium sp. H78 TaxID=3133417 RepID=UPI0030B7190C